MLRDHEEQFLIECGELAIEPLSAARRGYLAVYRESVAWHLREAGLDPEAIIGAAGRVPPRARLRTNGDRDRHRSGLNARRPGRGTL